MEEELILDNILGAEEIENLFVDDEVQDTSPEDEVTPDQEDGKEDKKNKEKDEETTEVIDVDNLFTDEPESVGSGKDNTKGKEDTSSREDSTSPQKTIYSSIAKALKEEGIFPDLDDEVLSKVNEPEDFRDLVEQQIKAGLEERQKRIDDALNYGIEPTEIKRYENTLNFLDSVKEENITDESDKGEELRKNLIFQDFINRGYSRERATREVQKSFNAGTDIEDAKEALKSNTEYFKGKYDDLIEDAKLEAQKEEENRKEQANKLKESILNEKNILGDLSIDKPTRQKIYDNISKPIYKDPETGEYYTAIQKYEKDNRVDFLKYLGLIFTLTDGFKSLDGLVKGKVKKEVKNGLRDLEHAINNTARNSDGNLKFVSGVDEDPESFIGKGWKIDV
jgi:vacuolar-type H+-ATPase subunit H